jgi:hypothetical protein
VRWTSLSCASLTDHWNLTSSENPCTPTNTSHGTLTNPYSTRAPHPFPHQTCPPPPHWLQRESTKHWLSTVTPHGPLDATATAIRHPRLHCRLPTPAPPSSHAKPRPPPQPPPDTGPPSPSHTTAAPPKSSAGPSARPMWASSPATRTPSSLNSSTSRTPFLTPTNPQWCTTHHVPATSTTHAQPRTSTRPNILCTSN